MPMPLLLLLLAIACGQGVPGARVESGTDEGGTSDGSACGNIAAEYHAAFAEALVCDPASPNACTEWRPLTVAVVPNGGNTSMAQITGLCWVAYEGYVTQRGAARLDPIIAGYTAAGCTIAYCPSPAPHATVCAKNAAGKFSCGGT